MNTRRALGRSGMDGLLALIVAMAVFALLIFFVSRSAKTIVAVGLGVVAILVVLALGLLGG